MRTPEALARRPWLRRDFLKGPIAAGAWCATNRLLAASPGSGWRAGVGRTKITPSGPVWMAGYGSRNRECDYPIQCWRLGDLAWIALGGEPVVEYSLALKESLGPNIWALGYSNEIMAYIPSERVLQEGGYEGATSMEVFGLPAPWATGLEQKILAAAQRLARA